MKRVKGIVERVTNPNITFEKRTVSLVSFFAEIAIIVSLIGDFIIEENIVEIVVLLLFTIINPMVIHYAFKHDRISIAPKFQTIALTFVALPISFFFGGGPLGGGIFWVAFVYMYIGVVLTGRFRIFMAISLTGIVLGEYIAWFINPDIVTFHSHRDFAVDSIVSLLLVGIIIALSIHFEKLMFKRENLRAKEAVKIAEELNISQNLFFSRMSHEIRTPINSILGLNEIILRDENATEEIKRDATNIQGAGKMLLALVNDILDISKIEAGKMDIVPVNYSLGTMVSEIPQKDVGVHLA